MKVSAQTDKDMEIFLRLLGDHLGKISAKVVIDLYVDFEISTPEAGEAFLELRSAAAVNAAQSKRTFLSRLFGQGRDKFMAVPLDLSSESGIRHFSLLAHRVIGCEAYLGGRIVFSSIENENLVCVDLADDVVAELVESARQSGARSVTLEKTSEAPVAFSGMAPWVVESEIIYCTQTELGEIDLHNYSDLVNLVVSAPGEGNEKGTAVFDFRDLRSGRTFRIAFHEVSCISVSIPEYIAPEDSEVFHAFEYLGGGGFTFEAARASGKLTACAVSFAVGPQG